MANSKSTYLRQKVYEAVLNATAYTGPATIYVSLHTGTTGLTGTNEVTGNGYARTAVTMAVPVNGVGASTSTVTFPAPTPAAWGTLTNFGFWDASTGGNFMAGDVLASPIVTSIGVAVSFPIGNITWTET